MNENKKKILTIIGIVVLVILVATASVFALKSISNKSTNTSTDTAVTDEQADAVKSRAIEALKTDKTKAKELFEEAKEQYEELGDKDNVVDTEAQLWLLEHADKTE